MSLSLDVVDLGRIDYRAAWDRQLELVAARQRGAIGDTLLLCEHPHVITLGRSRAAEKNVLAPGDVPVVEIERGGDATYHGPGQLVAYPIVQLGSAGPEEKDLHRLLRNLEAGIIAATEEVGVVGAGRRAGATGVWIDGVRKLASIGIACRRWVTFHGVAVNVATDLAYFARINPCGFEANVMTSLSRELGRELSVAEFAPLLAARLAAALGRQLTSR